jgi:hypothetical protein
MGGGCEEKGLGLPVGLVLWSSMGGSFFGWAGGWSFMLWVWRVWGPGRSAMSFFPLDDGFPSPCFTINDSHDDLYVVRSARFYNHFVSHS